MLYLFTSFFVVSSGSGSVGFQELPSKKISFLFFKEETEYKGKKKNLKLS